LWLLYHRQWLALFLMIVAGLLLDVGIELTGADPVTAFVIGAGFSLFIGVQANDWRRAKLARYGHWMTGIVASNDHDGAMRRYFDLNSSHETPAFRQPYGAAISGL